MQQPQHVYRVGSAGPSEKVTLGDGSSLDVAGKGTVYMDMVLINGSRRGRANLAYNLISVSSAGEAGKSVIFDDLGCECGTAEGVWECSPRPRNVSYLDTETDTGSMTTPLGRSSTAEMSSGSRSRRRSLHSSRRFWTQGARPSQTKKEELMKKSTTMQIHLPLNPHHGDPPERGGHGLTYSPRTHHFR